MSRQQPTARENAERCNPAHGGKPKAKVAFMPQKRRKGPAPCAWCQRAGDLELALEAVRNHESDSLDRLVAAAEQIMTEWRKRRCNNVRCGSQRQQ